MSNERWKPILDWCNVRLEEIAQEKSKDVWETIPCLVCPALDMCGIGQEINPIECPCLNLWISSELKQK